MFIALKFHHDDSRHAVYVKPGQNPIELVEKGQRNAAKMRPNGRRPGVTWKAVDGGLVQALAVAAKL